MARLIDHAPSGLAAAESTGIYPYRAVWERRHGGPLVVPMSVVGDRTSVRRDAVTVIGTVNYEPSMVRVRLSDGSVVRAMVADIRPETGAGHPQARLTSAGTPRPSTESIAARARALVGWNQVAVEIWRKHYGGWVYGEVRSVAAGIYTGGTSGGDQRGASRFNYAIAANHGFPDGRVSACEAVDAMYAEHIAPHIEQEVTGETHDG